MLSIHEIHQRIEDLDTRLMALPDEIETARQDAATSESTWRTELAKVRLRERDKAREDGVKQPTQDELEDRAHREADGAFQAHLFATANAETLRDVLKVTQTRADLMRTLAASFRQAGG